MAIKDNTAESDIVGVHTGLINDNSHNGGPIYFQPVNPYILDNNSCDSQRNTYLRVNELNPMIITFSKIMTVSSLTNIKFYSKTSQLLTPASITVSTQTILGIKRTVAKINTTVNSILTPYWLQIKINIQSTNGSNLVINPFNPLYNTALAPKTHNYSRPLFLKLLVVQLITQIILLLC